MLAKLNGEHQIILDNISALSSKVDSHFMVVNKIEVAVGKIEERLGALKSNEERNSNRIYGLQRWMWMGMGGLSLLTLISLFVGIAGALGVV